MKTKSGMKAKDGNENIIHRKTKMDQFEHQNACVGNSRDVERQYGTSIRILI